jgi:D-glycero-alpha-D-manno-heptose-7-phosphate kinase
VLVSRTPLRLSLIGGGSDLPEYYERQPGAVISMAIDKFVFVTVNCRLDERIRVSYTRTELVDSLDDLQHGLIREGLRLAGFRRGVEVTTIGDLPAGTGLGSSSSVTVGLVNALGGLARRRFSPSELAERACHIEIERLGRPIGKQDQYAAAFGGFNLIAFHPDRAVTVRPVRCAAETRAQLIERLLLFYTGTSRDSSVTLADVRAGIRSNGAARRAIDELVALVAGLEDDLARGDVSAVGRVLDRAWELKKRTAPGVTTEAIDALYARALDAGAEGGKLLGAGGGGCLLLYASSSGARESVCGAMTRAGLTQIPFRCAMVGSTIVYDGDDAARG